ncbi:baseplate J/gp47 family protein [Mergibacter septicus]|nr:baseplate J/gp47 family protein [Mergibacter septicus]UTU48882.1 baseplate J/gp47 family protein [Mergibacter septicus]WMR96814.1 baseplate J/gp47 family protein [Mergibacter septicus]
MQATDVKIVDDDLQKILTETITDYENRTGKTLQPAHIERSIIQTYAYREFLVRKGINEAFLQTFPQFATGLALDLCGEIIGCHRLENQAARCLIRFSLNGEHDDLTIEKGTKVFATDTLYFSTLTTVKIARNQQYTDVEAIANLTGEIGNDWQIGQVKKLVNVNPALTASNLDVSSGGIITESDDDYRKRILLAPEALTTCGSIGAYTYHTFSVSPSIADVVISTPIAGTVQITVLTKNGLPSASLLKQIKQALNAENVRPLCDNVEVVAPEKINYQINARLDLFSGFIAQDVLVRANLAIRHYLSNRSKKLGIDIIPLEIQSILKVEGVYNVHLTSPALIEVASNRWAECSEVQISLGEVKNG